MNYDSEPKISATLLATSFMRVQLIGLSGRVRKPIARGANRFHRAGRPAAAAVAAERGELPDILSAAKLIPNIEGEVK